MQINTLKLKLKRKKRKTIGRGGKKGTYSGRGNKGQKARSGASVDPLFEGGRSTLIDHMKKKRGFKSRSPKAIILDFSRIEDKFKDGDTLNKEALIKAGIIGKIEIANRVKILNSGKIKKKITVSDDILVSASAKDAIEKAGGKVEVKSNKKGK